MPASSNSRHTHTHFHVIWLILLFLIGIVVLKHLYERRMWGMYAVQSRVAVDSLKSKNSVEDSGIIGATIATLPSTAAPIWKQPKALEAYVDTLSRQTGRDIVIMGRDKMILADTVSSNVGTKYTLDKGDEITKTLGDGIARNFLEQSADYPSGIAETVSPLKDSNGTVVGAILLSNSKIFQ